jgi:uncharacterized membrane protein
VFDSSQVAIMNEINPYQPSPSAGARSVTEVEGYIAGGRTVEAGQGWEWIASGFDLFKKQPGIWVLLFVVFAVCMILIGLVPLLGGIATALLGPVFGAGFMLGCRALEDNQELTIEHLFMGFKRSTGDLIVVGLLSMAAMVAILVPVALIMGGAGLFAGAHGDVFNFAALGLGFAFAMLIALALTVPIGMALWFAPALVVFHDAKPVAALKESFLACLKNIIPFTLYAIVLFVLMIIAAIPLGLGYLILVPVGLASIYAAYRDIFFKS